MSHSRFQQLTRDLLAMPPLSRSRDATMTYTSYRGRHFLPTLLPMMGAPASDRAAAGNWRDLSDPHSRTEACSMSTRYNGGKDLRAQQVKVAAITALTAMCM
eukprot:2533959-Amphidinium_carterae.1